MTILTFAQWAKSVPPRYQAFFNTVLFKDPWWRFVPAMLWSGGKEIKDTIKTANPTIAALSEDGSVSEVAATYANMYSYLSELGGQSAIDVHMNANYISPMRGAGGNAVARAYADLAEGYAEKLRDEGINGGYMTEANVTLNAAIDGAGKGIDSLDAVSCAMPKGNGWLKFDDTANTVQFKAPGSSTYGTAVDASGDGSITVADGENSLHWLTFTLDASDWEGNGDFEYADAFLFQHPEAMKGLKGISQLDTNQAVSSSGATGDTVSLDLLDHLDQLCYGYRKMYVVAARTERAIRTLRLGLGGSDSLDFERNPLNGLVHNGHPIVISNGIGLDESKGGVSTLCRVYCVGLDEDEGLKFLYGAQDGAPVIERYLAADNSERSLPGPYQVPVFLRNIGEKESKNQQIVRCTGSGTLWLSNTKYISVGLEISN